MAKTPHQVKGKKKGKNFQKLTKFHLYTEQEIADVPPCVIAARQNLLINGNPGYTFTGICILENANTLSRRAFSLASS